LIKPPEQPTILRIRCKNRTAQNFRRIAIDYKNYEEALEEIMINHLKQVQSTPIQNKKGTYQ
jgi:hypothetical protein